MSLEMNVGEWDEETQQRISELGHISIHPEVLDVLDANDVEMQALFERYVKGDYGVIKEDEAWKNDTAWFKRMGRAKAVYELPSGVKIEVLTIWCSTITEVKLVEEPDAPVIPFRLLQPVEEENIL